MNIELPLLDVIWVAALPVENLVAIKSDAIINAGASMNNTPLLVNCFMMFFSLGSSGDNAINSIID